MNIFAARILVFGPGWEFEIFEIIDLIDPNFKKIVKTSWATKSGSFSGIVGNQPFFGGGINSASGLNSKNVMILNKKKEIIKLKTPRFRAASCKISQNAYLISGGIDNDDVDLETSEIIEFKPEEDKWIVRKGMDLPVKIGAHSAVKWDENTIYIIGGLSGSEVVRTWILDMEGSYRQGPSLNIPRLPDEVVTAAIITSNGKRKIIAAHCDSVEILDPESSDEGWIQGNI